MGADATQPAKPATLLGPVEVTLALEGARQVALAEYGHAQRKVLTVPETVLASPFAAVLLVSVLSGHFDVGPDLTAFLCAITAFFALNLAAAVRPRVMPQRPGRAASRATASYFRTHGAEVPGDVPASSLSATFSVALTSLGPEEVCQDGTLVRTPWCLLRGAAVTRDHVVLVVRDKMRDDTPSVVIGCPSSFVDGGAAVLPRSAVGGRAACRALARDVRRRVREARRRWRRARRLARRGRSAEAERLLAPELAWLAGAERDNRARGLPTSAEGRGAVRGAALGDYPVSDTVGPYPPGCLLEPLGPWW